MGSAHLCRPALSGHTHISSAVTNPVTAFSTKNPSSDFEYYCSFSSWQTDTSVGLISQTRNPSGPKDSRRGPCTDSPHGQVPGTQRFRGFRKYLRSSEESVTTFQTPGWEADLVWAAKSDGVGGLQTTEMDFSQVWRRDGPAQSASMVGGGPSSGSQAAYGQLSLCSHRTKGITDLPGLLFIRARIPTHLLVSFQRPRLVTLSHGGLRCPPLDVGATRTSSPL